MNKFIRRLAAFFLAAAIILNVVPVRAFEVYYDKASRQRVSKGIWLEERTMITDIGLLDVNILRIPLNDPDIRVSAADSGEELGLKETVTKILADSGAIAGINGDFFGTAGNYSMPSGLQINQNGVLSVSDNQNGGENKYASLMLADDGNFFMYCVNTRITFLNNGEENLKIGSINKVADLAGPAVITPDAMSDTAELDARLDDAVKVLVRNGVITYISDKGETVEIPWDGYIVIMSASAWDEHGDSFAAGQKAELTVASDIDIDSLKTALSGGGKVLSNGQTVTEGSFYITGAQPRSAVGINEDMTELILLTVDGRGDSAGVTHEQLAQVMLDAGAYNAMHLDGGGSTVMAAKLPSDDVLGVVNNPSGGAQRKVINALGVYIDAPVGPMRWLFIEPEQDTFIINSPLKINAYGLDEYMRRVDIPDGLLNMYASGGTFFDGYFNAFTPGAYSVFASFGNFTAQCMVYATELYELTADVAEIRTYMGGTAALGFTGIGANGGRIGVDVLSVGFEVYPPGLGEVVNGVFTAKNMGTGWIRCFVGNVSTYIPVYCTISEMPIDMLAGEKPLSFLGYPDNVVGLSYYAYIPDIYSYAARLSYKFDPSGATQAAYAVFEGIDDIYAKGFKLSVYGDMSGHWLRGRVVDASGKAHLIDFAMTIDFAGFAELEAWLPDDAEYPVRLERIYAASLSNAFETYHNLYFYNLRGLYDNSDKYEIPETPADDRFADPLMTVFTPGEEYGYDITVARSFEGLISNRQAAIDAFSKHSSAGVYMGTDSVDVSMPLFQAGGEYAVSKMGGLHIVRIPSAGGGIMSSDASVWAKIRQALEEGYSKNILIITEVSPLSFKNKREGELLLGLLAEYAQAGKNVFVVSEGLYNDVYVRDGVRYISLAGPVISDGVYNPDFSVLRFRLSGDDIKYSIERVRN